MGLLGTYSGIILFLALGPIQFFLFEQFFRAIPKEVIEAAVIDGADEWQILFRIVLPMARRSSRPSSLITFLLNWAQWFPVLVVSRSPDTYTLPVALLTLNGELGVEFSGHHGAGRAHDAFRSPSLPDGAAAGDGRHGRGAVKG